MPQTPRNEFDAAVSNAKETFKTWKETPISARVRYMLKYQELIKQNQVCTSVLIFTRIKSLTSSRKSTERVS